MAAWRAAARATMALGYPLVIYCALTWFEPRVIAAALVVVLLVRQRNYALRYVSDLSWASRGILSGLILLSVLALVQNDETLVRLYPAALSVAFLLVFGLSLHYPPSVVERIARASTPDLAPPAVCYTRQVTRVWCVFFALNGLAAAWTAIWASREVWAVYNGFVSYVVMGLLFAGEWLFRRRLFPEGR